MRACVSVTAMITRVVQAMAEQPIDARTDDIDERFQMRTRITVTIAQQHQLRADFHAVQIRALRERKHATEMATRQLGERQHRVASGILVELVHQRLQRRCARWVDRSDDRQRILPCHEITSFKP